MIIESDIIVEHLHRCHKEISLLQDGIIISLQCVPAAGILLLTRVLSRYCPLATHRFLWQRDGCFFTAPACSFCLCLVWYGVNSVLYAKPGHIFEHYDCVAAVVDDAAKRMFASALLLAMLVSWPVCTCFGPIFGAYARVIIAERSSDPLVFFLMFSSFFPQRVVGSQNVAVLTPPGNQPAAWVV